MKKILTIIALATTTLLFSDRLMAAKVDCSSTPKWQKRTVYKVSDQVKFRNKKYTANRKNRRKQPTKNFGSSQAWKRNGRCRRSTDPGPIISSEYKNVIPRPTYYKQGTSSFDLNASTTIYVQPGLVDLGQYLVDKLDPATGYALQVVETSRPPPSNAIYLTTSGAPTSLGNEEYELDIDGNGVTALASTAQGLFHSIQTILQLLPPEIHLDSPQSRINWGLYSGSINDRPRYVYRGLMLDVARHFFSIEEIKRHIDIMALYKINYLHLHLSDDQGWRLEIGAWPKLAAYGGITEVGGGVGGYYTQAQFTDLVAYAEARHITIVPELDMPGHTNAALAAYPELNCNGISPGLYTGVEVGFSSLCIGTEATNRFVRNVIEEVAPLINGPYIHIGGDEAFSTSTSDYVNFVNFARAVIEKNGKQMMGWANIGVASIGANSVGQHWFGSGYAQAVAIQGSSIVMSPADKIYLDIKYDWGTELGLTWAGLNDTQDAYNWDPASHVPGIANNILGVEAPLWTETIQTGKDIDYMIYPRLLGLAELGWTAQSQRNWSDYRERLSAHGKRLDNLNIDYYRTSLVDWP